MIEDGVDRSIVNPADAGRCTTNGSGSGWALRASRTASAMAPTRRGRPSPVMAEKVAPWLTVDSDPYPVVVDGRIQWVLDGYTVTDKYPLSQKESFEEMTDERWDFIYAVNVRGTFIMTQEVLPDMKAAMQKLNWSVRASTARPRWSSVRAPSPATSSCCATSTTTQGSRRQSSIRMAPA